ncbi:MAG: hypothetical protein DRJ38_08650 [Thermoprotei archaeon]|nr:MAG: hypothetical protein DRJ38_08650 [Thermoprotei archaeon]
MSEERILDCGRYIYLPKRKLAGYAINFTPESLLKVGVLKEVTEILTKYSVPILFLSLSRPNPGETLRALLFVDLTNADIGEQELREKLNEVSDVARAELIKPVFDGMLIDVYFEKLYLGSKRAVLFREPLYRALIKETVKELGSGGFALLYHIGVFMGRSVYKDYLSLLGMEDPKSLVELGKAFFRMSGFGILEIIYLDFEKKEVLLRVYDSFECSLYENEKKPMGNLVRGIFAGWFSELFKTQKIEVTETKCIAVGDKYCEFLVKGKI